MEQSARITSPCSRASASKRRVAVAVVALAALSAFACTRTPPRELTELVVQDSTYLEPETMLPYTGPVLHTFPGDEGRVQLEATLRDGTWEGELTVFHQTGRVRYQGEMSAGARCGAWVENENPTAPKSAYEAIKEDLESLVIYPDCP